MRTTIAWWCAVAYGIAVIGIALLAPLYSSATEDSDGVQSLSTATLVEVEGVSGLVTMSVPLLVTLAVGAARVAPTRWGRPVAWVLWSLLCVGTVLALMSVGVLVLPLTVALLIVCLEPGSARMAERASVPA
ncbi:hypothetical protein [Demequina iriomotensis]|uniref:hypothetical protein n=1 Tax=Demequina iriomotensis TaxID=1536641 RepID=UPI0007842859|nr:hypothetical protein [Demequina iriomotensis]